MSRIGSTKFGGFGDLGTSSSGKSSLAPLNSKAKDLPSSKNVPKIEPNDFVPKRFGLRYTPPTIIVEYLVPSSGKLYHHKMKMSNLKADSSTFDALDALKKRHPLYFSGNKIADNQITDFIDRLKKKLQGNSTTGSTFLTGGFGENKDSGAKLGKLAPISSSPSTKQNNNLTSLDANKAKGGVGTSKLGSAEKKKDAGNFWDFEDLEDLEDEDEEKIDYDSTNLNKLSNEELQKHKDKMTVLFSKNQKKPGDKDFVYDKQEEFEGTENNEWDEEF